MSRRNRATASQRSVFGLGLVALDVVLDGGSSEPALYCGGTCANVLIILSYLGWNARPIARLGSDPAASVVRSDLRRWGVDLGLSNMKPASRTPIVVERIRVDRNGVPFHTFSFCCYECGSRFPGFQPVTGVAVAELANGRPTPDVLFVDRASKSGVVLAEAYTECATLVVFEPQTIDESRSCRKLLDLAHIVKYSHERVDELPLSASRNRILEIQTLGRGGVRFRTGRQWDYLEAEDVRDLRDAAGSGDWLTAGVIHSLGGRWRAAGDDIEAATVERALAVGQRLAAWNCSFAGARGGMYSARLNELKSMVEGAVGGESAGTGEGERQSHFARRICPRCSADRPETLDCRLTAQARRHEG